jgi:hypothetical protein
MGSSDEATSSPSKFAILIGLDFYVDHTQQLRGAVNDVDDVQLYLSRNHTFESLSRLVAVSTGDESQTEPTGPESSWPTYENITNELERVTKSAVSGDFVYIHYSGHGTLSPTTAKEYEEHLGSDAALVLYDKTTGVRYLRGIELALLFNRMVHKGIQLTVVLDCCHSGAVSRSKRRSVRGVPWDARIASAYPLHRELSPALPTNRDRDGSTNQHWLLRPQAYTLLGACGPTELACECVGAGNRQHGALTYFLFRTLSTISRNNLAISLGLVYKRVCAELRIALPQQHPVILGSESSILFSPDRIEGSSRGGCNVVELLAGNRVTLDVGSAHMVGLGDEYILTPFASDSKKITESVALFKIVAVDDLHSEAEMIQAPKNGVTLAKGWHASLHKPCRDKARVVVSGNEEQALHAMIAQSPWLEPVDRMEDPLPVPAFNVVIEDNITTIIHLGTGEEIKYLPLAIHPADNKSKRIVTILEHLAKIAAIEGLGNDISSPLVSLESNSSFDQKTKTPSLGPGFSVSLGSKTWDNTQVSNNIITICDGEVLPIVFQNSTQQSLFLTVFNLTPLRKVSKIYPSSDRGQYKEIPPRSTNYTGMAGFRMRMSIPDQLKSKDLEEVEDILKFFITTRPVSSLHDALWLPELSEEGLMKRRDQSSEQALSNLLDDPVSFWNPGGTWRSEGGRWTCINYLVRTQRKKI